MGGCFRSGGRAAGCRLQALSSGGQRPDPQTITGGGGGGQRPPLPGPHLHPILLLHGNEALVGAAQPHAAAVPPAPARCGPASEARRLAGARRGRCRSESHASRNGGGVPAARVTSNSSGAHRIRPAHILTTTSRPPCRGCTAAPCTVAPCRWRTSWAGAGSCRPAPVALQGPAPACQRAAGRAPASRGGGSGGGGSSGWWGLLAAPVQRIADPRAQGRGQQGAAAARQASCGCACIAASTVMRHVHAGEALVQAAEARAR